MVPSESDTRFTMRPVLRRAPWPAGQPHHTSRQVHLADRTVRGW